MFEYEVLSFSIGWRGYDYRKIQEQLNEYGRHGWRVVGNHDASVAGNVPSEIVIVLERPLSPR